MQYNLTTDKSWHETRSDLEDCFRKWKVGDWNIITEVQPAQSTNWSQTKTQLTVTLRYVHASGQEMRLTMDRQSRAIDNLRVLYLAVNSLRLNEARGLSDVMQEAYLQLGSGEPRIDPYEVLQVRPDATLEVIEASYIALSKTRHPDRGGTVEAMKELNDAVERLRKERDVVTTA